MHEYSVVSSLIELCEEKLRDHGAGRIEKIIVVIGERAGMDKSLFVSAFEAFREESEACRDAILEIKDEKIALQCNQCRHEFEPGGMEYGICPSCQSQDLKITKGRDMYLLSLELLG